MQNKSLSPTAKHWTSMAVFASISLDFGVRKPRFGSMFSHCDVISKPFSTAEASVVPAGGGWENATTVPSTR